MIAQSLLPEFQHEVSTTRKVLERLPDDKWTWKPHAKSMDLGSLATHLANLANWMTVTINVPELDLPPDFKMELLPDRAALLAFFDRESTAAQTALGACSDEAMMQPWTLKVAGNPMFTMPRVAVIRSMVMNHLIHHRAQLALYLRLNDVPVPALYGPSADER